MQDESAREGTDELEIRLRQLEDQRIAEEFASMSQRIRKRRLVLYFGRNTFSDNTKYLFLADVARGADYEMLWCTFDPDLAATLDDAGLPFFDMGQDINRTIDLLLHAAVAVFCVNPSESLRGLFSLNACLTGARKLQLWHGVSVKQLLLKLVPHLGVNDIRYRRPYYMASQADMVLSTAKAFDGFWQGAFGCNRLVRAGFPRNEVLLRTPDPYEMIGSEIDAETEAALDGGRRNVLFVPTWQRDQPTYLTSAAFLEKLATIASQKRINFFLKLHPFYHNPTRILESGRDGIIMLNPGLDIYPLANRFDLLLTDYSSIMFDFLLTGKPVMSLDIPPGIHQNFEPDFSLVPDVPFRHVFTPPNFEATLNAALDEDDLGPQRAEMVSRIFESDPLQASAQLLSVIDSLVEEVQSSGPTVLYPVARVAGM